MADLSLQQLADQLPAGSLTETADDVTISLKAVTGEASIQLADTKVGECLSKVVGGAALAEDAYNTANPNAQLNSYPNPTFGAATSDGSGGFAVTRNHNIAVRVPLDTDEITAVSL